jgi:hypothetical protein
MDKAKIPKIPLFKKKMKNEKIVDELTHGQAVGSMFFLRIK